MTTQNCAECGTRAEPGQSFCDACGAVLSWTDRAPARTAAGSAAADDGGASPTGFEGAAGRGGSVGGHGSTLPPAEARPHGGPRRHPAAGTATDADADAAQGDVSAAPGAGDTAGDTPGAADASGPGDPGIRPTPPTGPTTPAPAPAPAPDETAPTEPLPPAAALGDTMAARARSLLVPVADPEDRPAAVPSVAPVLPGRPDADRPQVRAPGPPLGDENGVPCPWCATPNRPDRHFCARCAMPMARDDRAPELHRPWWRRLLNPGSRDTPWAGDRPRLRRTFDRVLTWVVAAVVLTLLVLAGVHAPAAVQATRDHFAKRAPVAPDRIQASRSYQGHQPQLAFDKINNTWWGPGVSQSGEGQWIEATFDEPTRLLDLIITPGVSIRPDQLSQSALPHRLKATITTKDGRTTTRELTLDQAAGGQRRAFRIGGVTKVRFTVESAYAVSASKQISIAEIEFFGPSSANSS
ncbi:NADase-type glycan-binding domain-containing protein [Streptomyces sp. NPDC002306]